MRKQTDLAKVKQTARSLLFTDIHETEFSPVIVSHPFTDSGFVASPNANGEIGLLNITESDADQRRWREYTVDGYLWTNAFDYQYLFNIGEDAAGKIIKYAKENSTEADYEPYRNTIVGKITEITDEYILLDDSILCTNPDDGITYKILLNDLRISRYAESGTIRVGENVQITYEGEIDESNIIDSAISASDVVISGGDVLIPE